MTGLTSTSNTTASQLSKTGNGEYTAASVSSDPTDASKLGLVKELDGNYGTVTPVPLAISGGNPAAQSASGVQVALTFLKLGGA